MEWSGRGVEVGSVGNSASAFVAIVGSSFDVTILVKYLKVDRLSVHLVDHCRYHFHSLLQGGWCLGHSIPQYWLLDLQLKIYDLLFRIRFAVRPSRVRASIYLKTTDFIFSSLSLKYCEIITSLI